ncbi:MAG: sensor histidine kinase [Spirochaetota bacterium]
MSRRRARSVGWRYTTYTFVLVLLISAVFVSVEGYRSYRHEVERLNTQIVQIQESHVPSIVSSLWLTDNELLQRQLDAIALFEYVARVEITDDYGTTFAAGSNDRPGTSKRSHDLIYVRRGVEFDVGTMDLFIDQARIRTVAVRREIVSAAGYLLMALLASGTVALLFRRLVGRHLERLSARAQSAMEPNADIDFSLDRRESRDDELERLAEALRRMHHSLVGHVEERELLMREVHHRIKNDLAFVTGLLSLQAHRSNSHEVVTALKEAGQRVSVVAEIYEATYTGPSMRTVDLHDVASRVIVGLNATGTLAAETVRAELDHVEVPVRESVAFGVVLNELLTNAAKYAREVGPHPDVRVRLARAQSPCVARLEVTDNGPGFPPEVLSGERQGYGLTIAKALVDQHDGTLSIANQNGARVVVEM